MDRNYEPHLDDEKEMLTTRLGGEKNKGVTTGGLRLRTDGELSELLDYWIGRGVNTIHSSFGGIGDTHDYYNRRVGDYLQLMSLQRLASIKRMNIGQSIFVTKRTIFQIDRLEEVLNDIGSPIYRNIYPFGFLGLAKNLEIERIEEPEREALLSARKNTLLRPDTWISERE